MASFQFLHLGSYGRSPGSDQPRWSCVEGITAEGARTPCASRHIRYPAPPTIIFGVSPIEAGRLATERAGQARDEGEKFRRVRKDGICLLAGVASYPIDNVTLREDPVDGDAYDLWRGTTVAWLQEQFGDHLKSVVEHSDERFRHLHFYAVPELRDDGRLDINQIHPGRRAKAAAAAAGAGHNQRERAYRDGMRQWQDAFHRDVSEIFRHERYGPRRQRVSRRQHQMEEAMAAERLRLLDAVERASIEAENAARRRGWERYAAPYRTLQQNAAVLADRHGAEVRRRLAAEAECAALRERLAALEPAAASRPTV